MKRLLRTLRTLGISLLVVLVLLITAGVVASRRSVIPDNLNMGAQTMPGMSNMPGTTTGSGSVAPLTSAAIPVTTLVQPPTDAPVRQFTLTAQTARVDLGNGQTVNAYTFNGSVPGPELRVQQGDLVVVTLVNHLPVSTSIHWHGISVPNAEDGVPGVTQDAVKPGQSYTYRFVAAEVGTYWYHSHQETSIQLPLGLYGPIIVEPKNPPAHYDRDYAVFLQEWGAPDQTSSNGLTACRATCPATLAINSHVDQVAFAAAPGQTVRLRIANSGQDVHQPVLVGTAFTVIALDGHDLNQPTPLTGVALPIIAAQRYDLSFVMPAHGTVVLIDDDSRADPAGQHPMVVFGDGPVSAAYPAHPSLFDFTHYGAPAAASAGAITMNSHFDVNYDMTVGEIPGFFNGAPNLVFTINNQAYPNIPALQVKAGDLVQIHMVGGGMFPFPHAMHLHGHVFTVLAHNGQPLSGSPVRQDTILVQPGESYDVAFRADNPGLWMLHCHMVSHDARGMDMMVVYDNISTPYTIGTKSGNNPF